MNRSHFFSKRVQFSIAASRDWTCILRRFVALASLLFLTLSGNVDLACAQSLPENLPASGVALHDSPNPLRFFDVTGRNSAIFGHQNGQFEAWIYPIKLLHNFRLEFLEEGQPETVRGESLLREIVTRPESTTLVYVYPNFTVREILWAPLQSPALVIYFEVDCAQPLDITAAFVPDFKPMWPASFGGQHSSWIADQKAFALTDATEHATALVGSPAVSSYTQFTDHQLASGETILRLHFTAGQNRAPLVMTLDMDSSAAAIAAYRDVLSRSATLFEERVVHHQGFLSRTLSFESPDAQLNEAFLWSKLTLDSGWVCHPRHGCGLVAGYGPSGSGERPGFAWWFGGDAMMSSWALEDVGDLDGARQALRFLKGLQRDDGKMLHEMTQSVDLLDWFGKFHYAYYHADSTPMYLYSLGQYWSRTGDANFLDEFWPSLRKAYAYCLSTVTPEDGLMDNTRAGLAAVEVGVLRGKVVKDIYLEGFWVGALEAVQRMAAAKGDASLADDAAQRAAKARASLSKNWWDPDRHVFTFGLTADGQRTDLVGVWPSVLLALSDQMNAPQATAAASAFADPRIATDWGARWLANDHPLYDPLSYNNGTAWPFMSGFAAWAQYRHGLPLSAFSLWSSVALLTGLSSPGAVPELMNGDRDLAGEFAVPHQLFSSDGVLLPAVRGVLGLETQGPASTPDHPPQISFAPSLPADWHFLRFGNYSIGRGHLAGEVLQQPSQTILRLKYEDGSPVLATLAPSVPAASRVKAVSIDGKPVKFSLHDFGRFVRVNVAPFVVRPSTQVTLTVDYDGGIGIVPPEPHPQAGERSSALKILRVESNTQTPKCLVRLAVAGLAGHSYALSLVSTLGNLQASGLVMRKEGADYMLQIPFETAGSESLYLNREVCVN